MDRHNYGHSCDDVLIIFRTSRFFTAIPSSHPGERRLFRLKVETPHTDHVPVCISCSEEQSNKNSTATLGGTPVTTPSPTSESKKGSRKGGQHSDEKGKSGKGLPVSGKETNKPDSKGSSSSGSSSSRNSSTMGTAPITGEQTGSKQQMLRPDKSCSFVSNVKFSQGKTYFIMECAGPDVPFVLVCEAKTPPRYSHHRSTTTSDYTFGSTTGSSTLVQDGQGGAITTTTPVPTGPDAFATPNLNVLAVNIFLRS